MPGTLNPAFARARSPFQHARSQSTPPIPPHLVDEYKQKQRDDDRWKRAWKEYEERKAHLQDTAWTEYHQHKESVAAAQWREYEATKELASKMAEMDIQARGARSFSPSPEDYASSSSRSSSRSPAPEQRHPRMTPVAPRPLYTYQAAAAPSSATSTPPPHPLRVSTPGSPLSTSSSSWSAASTPPRTPTSTTYSWSSGYRSSSSTASSSRHQSPAPSLFTPTTSRSATPSTPHHAPSPLLKTATTAASGARKRCDTEKSQPQLFMPKPVQVQSEGASSSRRNVLDDEELFRRLADQQRRCEMAYEAARQKAEADRLANKASSSSSSSRKRSSTTTATSYDRDYHIRSAWETYEDRWRALQEGTYPAPGMQMSIKDVPWPVVGPVRSPADLDRGRLEGFLLWTEGGGTQPAKVAKSRIRDAMLRFHPDRFEGRWMSAVRAEDRDAVQEAVGVVVRFLNEYSSRLG